MFIIKHCDRAAFPEDAIMSKRPWLLALAGAGVVAIQACDDGDDSRRPLAAPARRKAGWRLERRKSRRNRCHRRGCDERRCRPSRREHERRGCGWRRG